MPGARVDEDDVAAGEAAPIEGSELREDGQSRACDAVQRGAVRGPRVLRDGGILDHEDALPEVGEEARALATLGLPQQDRRADLRVELGGPQRRRPGYTRVALRAHPEVNSPYGHALLQLLCLENVYGVCQARGISTTL